MRSFSRVYSASYTDLRRYPVIRFASDYGEAIEDAKREKARAKERAYQRRVYRIHSRALLKLAQIADVEA